MQWFHRRSTKCGRGRGRRRRTNSARISHPPFRRVTKNGLKPCGFIQNYNSYKNMIENHEIHAINSVNPHIRPLSINISKKSHVFFNIQNMRLQI